MAKAKDKCTKAKSPLPDSPLPVGFPKKWPYIKELCGDLTNDEWMAHCFLFGYDQPISAKGKLIDLDPEICRGSIYVKATFLRGETETQGRNALVRLLRSHLEAKKPLPDLVMEDLTELFENKWRKLSLKSLSKNQSSNVIPQKDRAIAYFIQHRLSKPPRRKEMENAVSDAMVEFGISRNQIFTAWRRDKLRYPQFH
jgi:hypothetical protein